MNKRIKNLFRSFSAKVTLTVCIMMVVCSLIWTSVMFVNMRNTAINNKVNEEWTYIEKTSQNIDKIQEVCNMAIQIVSQMESVIEYLEDVQNGNDMDTSYKIDFYNNDIAAINNITNLNPYLNQIRLFVNSDTITEKSPCLYRKSRMNNLEWASDRQDGVWNIDYPDEVFPDNTSDEHLAGITNTLLNSKGEELCVLEIATEMSSLFPDLYTKEKNISTFFVEDSGEIHCANKDDVLAVTEEIKNYIKKTGKNSNVYTTQIGGYDVVLSVTYIESFSGSYVHMTELDSVITSYYDSQKAYIIVVICSLILCLVLVAVITTNIFKRFNVITDATTKIKQGETDLRIETDGDDEISDLAEQINEMLDGIQHLNEENTNRQLLVKNTEIKALQNQINAHFMYNVLESIKMMAEIERQYDISDAVTSLGQMFRYSVKWTSGKVELKEEVEYIRNYLALMNLRLDSEVILALNIPDELMKYKIPKMALQPIVENSVMHGIEEDGTDTSIYVKAYADGDMLHIEVSDNGKGISTQGLNKIKEKLKGEIKADESNVHGLALKNVQNRIKMYYGDKYGLEIYSEEGKYTKVVLLLPYVKGDNKDNG